MCKTICNTKWNLLFHFGKMQKYMKKQGCAHNCDECAWRRHTECTVVQANTVIVDLKLCNYT